MLIYCDLCQLFHFKKCFSRNFHPRNPKTVQNFTKNWFSISTVRNSPYRVAPSRDFSPAIPLPKTHLPTLRHPWTRHLTRPPPKATFLRCGNLGRIISTFHCPKLIFQRCGIPEPAISPDHRPKLPSYVSASLNLSSHYSVNWNTPCRVATSRDFSSRFTKG